MSFSFWEAWKFFKTSWEFGGEFGLSFVIRSAFIHKKLSNFYKAADSEEDNLDLTSLGVGL